MNEFVSWCRHLLVSFLFHALTSLHPPSFHRNDFPTCSTHFSFILVQSPEMFSLRRAHVDFMHAHAHAENLNMAYPTKLVHRWSKLGSPGATSFFALSTEAWGATGVHLIPSTIRTCHGPSVATATVSLYGSFSQQHVRWRLSTRG